MHPAEGFFDEWAGLYDEYYDEQRIGDADFYVELARETNGTVLEVGCGTGRVYLDLLRAGVDAYGIDISRAMLTELERNAAEDDLKPCVRRADMTAFEPKRTYDLIIVPFRTFLHNTTLADRQAALRNIYDALESGGRLVFNVFVPNFDIICETYGTPETQVIEYDGEEYTVTEISRVVDEIEQVIETERTLKRDGTVISESAFRLALVSKAEFELLFETTGWSDWTVYGGFDSEPLDESSQEMVWIAEK
ncbi:methyltransferase domain-containing protein [Natronorubrum sp. JWXQ-INN-674]|uniref:Methyltransferase domain-containing protein n=1 Tax=Natronorubrum halalkaliphilum TaxID=2691917 RepID=A0A6B0VIV8_9EURY|nr:class I SAM-dependent methyltransferase [Natronorubrum halalkaliphilum]MXV61464.1 methyltransferase domain-containing protein [Natronorubrum halalkaliphilum]